MTETIGFLFIALEFHPQFSIALYHIDEKYFSVVLIDVDIIWQWSWRATKNATLC